VGDGAGAGRDRWGEGRGAGELRGAALGADFGAARGWARRRTACTVPRVAGPETEGGRLVPQATRPQPAASGRVAGAEENVSKAAPLPASATTLAAPAASGHRRPPGTLNPVRIAAPPVQAIGPIRANYQANAWG
jgi:hypothetical protein